MRSNNSSPTSIANTPNYYYQYTVILFPYIIHHFILPGYTTNYEVHLYTVKGICYKYMLMAVSCRCPNYDLINVKIQVLWQKEIEKLMKVTGMNRGGGKKVTQKRARWTSVYSKVYIYNYTM